MIEYILKKDRFLNCKYFAIYMMTMLMAFNSNISKSDTIDQLISSRKEYIENFRIYGERDVKKAEAIESKLKVLAQNSMGKTLAQTLFELATIQRINNQFESAISNYKRATIAAKESQSANIEFESWMGLARSHIYSTRNHGAAAAAFAHSIASAGNSPTQKQLYDIADYSSQLQAGRGELEPALLNALDAINFAKDDSQRFYAYLDTADVLQKFAESCDYRKIVDAKTNSENDSWGACKRAVGAASTYYEKARITASKLSWRFMEKESQGFINALNTRLHLITQKAKFEQLGQTSIFNAQRVDDILINENFSSGGSELTTGLPLAALIDEVAPESLAHDPRSIYLRGIKADLDNNPELALKHFKSAAKLLGTERASMFDLRQRGTVVESRPELIRDLGLRLLAFKEYDEAFVVFESLRSHGLEWLATAFKKNNFTDTERKLIAGLVQLDSLISAKQNSLVETAIAGIEHSRSLELLNKLNQLKQQRYKKQNDRRFQPVVEKLKSIETEIPNMTQLKKSVDRAHIPVLLYWVTPTNVVIWVVSPTGIEVKTVFLPESAVIDKAGKLRDSLKTNNLAFDAVSAKELYTYLIEPFEKYLKQDQLIIIPQGPLVGLPFETLISAKTGKFLAETLSISYATNAAFAMRAFAGNLPEISRMTVLYDKTIEDDTHEIAQIKNIKNIQVRKYSSKDINKEKVIKIFGDAKIMHVLLHGEYNYDDPLQSTIKISERKKSHGKYITAAELLAADWRNTQLAVFSSCEGALVKTRISNEQFGISWALLAGGVDHLMLSRWRVNAASNALWMGIFYRSIAVDKMSPALAANAAMRTMISSDKQHPYYWAGPQVFGR